MISVPSHLLPSSGSRFLLLFFLLFCASLSLEAQTQFITYTVKRSETLTSIAKKFEMTRERLIKLNPDLKEGIVPGDILILPAFLQKKKNQKKIHTTHIVKPHETFFSIAVIYKTSEEKLLELNPSYAESDLQTGDVIKVPDAKKEETRKDDKKADKYFYHIVQPKETIWRICYKLGIDRAQLLKYNPKLKSGLKVDDTLTIPKDIIDPIENYHFHKVRPNESIESLATYYGVSQEQIMQVNKNLKYGIRPQVILKIPKHPEDRVNVEDISFVASSLATIHEKGVKITSPILDEVEKKDGSTKTKAHHNIQYTKETPTISDLTPTQPETTKGVITYKKLDTPSTTNTAYTPPPDHPPYLIKREIDLENTRTPFSYQTKNKRVRLAFMLPFFLKEYETGGFSQVKKASHDFALHFYSGARLAMEELSNQGGLDIEAKIYNTERENSLALKSIPIEQDTFLLRSDAVIGPFYTANVEYIARKLASQRIPVFSPFSKKHRFSSGEPSNLVQRHVSNAALQGNIFKYVYENYLDQNIILVGKYEDAHLAGYIKDQLKAKVPEKNIKLLLSFDENSFEPYEYDSLANYYKENWYVLATNDDVLVTDIVNGLYNLKDSLVCSVFAPYYSKVFDKLELSYLSKVNFHYPKASFIDLEDAKVRSFMKDYVTKYGREPGKFAFMGYDLTYDVALRLANYPSFYHSLSTKMRSGISNRFYYKRYKDGILYNTAGYVVSYDEDMEAVLE